MTTTTRRTAYRTIEIEIHRHNAENQDAVFYTQTNDVAAASLADSAGTKGETPTLLVYASDEQAETAARAEIDDTLGTASHEDAAESIQTALWDAGEQALLAAADQLASAEKRTVYDAEESAGDGHERAVRTAEAKARLYDAIADRIRAAAEQARTTSRNHAEQNARRARR